MTIRKVELLECSIVDGQMVTRAATGRAIELNGGVDATMKRAREILQERNKAIRSMNMLPDGNIRVVVWKDGKPPTAAQAGFIWKRPPAS